MSTAIKSFFQVPEVFVYLVILIIFAVSKSQVVLLNHSNLTAFQVVRQGHYTFPQSTLDTPCCPFGVTLELLVNNKFGDAWVTQSLKHVPFAWVMIPGSWD